MVLMHGVFCAKDHKIGETQIVLALATTRAWNGGVVGKASDADNPFTGLATAQQFPERNALLNLLKSPFFFLFEKGGRFLARSPLEIVASGICVSGK
jgi:hypothetical protein